MVDVELIGYEILIFILFGAIHWLDIRGYATVDIELFGFVRVDMYSCVPVFKR